MLNVANGNLLVQSDDLDVPERGIDLAFRRTYNSQSGHDASGSDGSSQSVFGNGWTNTFDAHIKYTAGLNASCPTAQGVTMYDIDGARYDFAPDCNGNFISPAGLQGTTMAAYSNGCILGWHKKTGTFYTFFSPDYSSTTCRGASYAAYDGRIHKIYGRNTNNVVVFTYSWVNGDATNQNNLASIQAAHSDGQQLTLNFALYGGHDELQNITRPDGQSVTYLYDAAGNLTDVCDIGNGSSAAASGPCSSGQIHYQYAYNANSHQLAWVNSANWVMSNYNCGTYQSYSYDGSNRATEIANTGTSNPYIQDGTAGGSVQSICSGSGSLLQSGYTADYGSCQTCQTQFFHETFSYGSGLTSLGDSDGHATNWYYDGIGRVTQTQEWTGSPNSLWLTSYASWDGSNNLTETVDARGNATDYGYDSNGNTIWAQQPQVATSLGTGRPIARYGYDQYNNLVAYCDPQYVWTSGITSCTATTGATYYTWNFSDSNEPYGYLTNVYSPLGYHHTIAYNTGAEGGGDYGLPTDITGDPISQTIDPTTATRTPHTSIIYDGYGNVACYATLQDSTATHWWRAAYDGLNRRTATADADDGSLSVPQCTNTPGLAGSYIQSTTAYYANGQVSSTQSPSEYAAGVSTTFSYDADGNETSETHDYGNQAGTTYKWYDGDDRLVEVQQPHDPRTFASGNGYDLFSFAWSTRYLYDLSQNGQVALDGASFHAYGNLYKTQEYLPATPVVTANTAPATPVWTDVRGTSFDALDRPLASYENAFGSLPKLTNTYDASGEYGLLSQTQNAVGEQAILTYLATGWVQEKYYQNDGGATPSETYTYDPDGRTTGIASSQFGSEQLSYDAGGRLTRDVEPSGGGIQAPATITYSYYADGLRQALSVSSSLFTQNNALQYAYRMDGKLEKESAQVSVYGSQSGSAVNGSFQWTYTPAGREVTQSDPDTGVTVTEYDANEKVVGSRTYQARTSTYDSFGRISQLVLPEGYTYSGLAYDAEGEPLSGSVSGAYCSYGCTGGALAWVYNIRGELLRQTSPGGGMPESASANGVVCTLADSIGTAAPGTCRDNFDARSGMMLAQCSAPYTYDAAGRQRTSLSGPPPSGYTGGNTLTRAYDAENHVVSSSMGSSGGYYAPSPECSGTMSYFGAAGQSRTYGWGPNGHPLTFSDSTNGSTPYTTYAHWNGGNVLFTNNAASVDFKVDKLAFRGGEIIDRDSFGQQAATHDGIGFSAFSTGDPAHPAGMCKNEACSGTFVVGSKPSDPSWSDGAGNELLTAPRTDGYNDGTDNVFQGVRALDNSTGQWTAPDAYAGDVHDPMSQKPFMWNRNNALQYADPSGYDPTEESTNQLANEVGSPAGAEYGAILNDEAFDASLKRYAAGGPGGTETVIRYGTRAEARAMQRTNLMRGGRDGTTYATNTVYKKASTAQARLSLPVRPEVRMTVRVPAGTFSGSQRVLPDFLQPGGGSQRTAEGKIPVIWSDVKPLKKP